MHLESPKSQVHRNEREVYEFLTDLKNFEQLMPPNIEKFQVLDADTFLFALKGMPEIVLKRKEQQPHSKVVLGAASDKLPFTLTANITAISAGESEVILNFQGEFNAMMAMMIKNPINNFITKLSENLAQI